jgi:hypothetical protein
MNLSGVPSPDVLHMWRKTYVNSSPVCDYKRMICLRGRAVISMLFHNVAAQLVKICTRGVSCDEPAQHAAYVVL